MPRSKKKLPEKEEKEKLPDEATVEETEEVPEVQAEPPVVRVDYVVRDGMISDDGRMMFITCDVRSFVVSIEQAFGPHARYKGRNVKAYLELVPVNAQVVIQMPIESVETLAAGLDVVAREVFDKLMIGVEATVGLAEERAEKLSAEAPAIERPQVEPTKPAPQSF